MSSPSFQWSNLLQTEFNQSEQWPDISTAKKSKRKTQNVNNFKNSQLELNTTENRQLNKKIEQSGKRDTELVSDYDRTADTRTREQIQEERAKRKADQAQQKIEQTYQQQVANRRSNKSEKIKLIDSETMTKMINHQHKDDTRNLSTVQRISSNKTKRKIQKLEISLMDLVIDTTKRKQQQQQQKSLEIRLKTRGNADRVIQRNKGKKREIPKKKWLSSLKKSILLSRQLNREQLKMENETKKDEVADLKTEEGPDKENDKEQDVVLSVPSINTPESDVYKFSRKFRP